MGFDSKVSSETFPRFLTDNFRCVFYWFTTSKSRNITRSWTWIGNELLRRSWTGQLIRTSVGFREFQSHQVRTKTIKSISWTVWPVTELFWPCYYKCPSSYVVGFLPVGFLPTYHLYINSSKASRLIFSITKSKTINHHINRQFTFNKLLLIKKSFALPNFILKRILNNDPSYHYHVGTITNA